MAKDAEASGVASDDESAVMKKAGPLLAGLTATGWSLPETLTMAQWRAAGQLIGAIGQRIPWAIGDWLVYGERRYGETYAQFAHETGYKEQTLMMFAYCSRRWPQGTRIEGLSWSHHMELGPLDDAERATWVKKVQKEGWSVGALRRARREAKGGESFADSLAAWRCAMCQRSLADLRNAARKAVGGGDDDAE